MKKRSVKVITLGIVLVLLFPLAGLTACKGREIVETDYFRVELYKKDGYAIVLELTESGKEQEILAVPMYVEGLPVKQIGGQVKIWSRGTRIESENLKKLYIPHTVEQIINEIFSAQKNEIIVNIIETPHAYFNFVRLLDSTIIHLNYDPVSMSLLRPNVYFMYNYLDSPNQGYFWYDYVSGSNSYILPPTPIRQGYTFKGWYFKGEIIQWNEQMPSTAEETLTLYAKWQKK